MVSDYIETTEQDFEEFKKECWKWIDIFGLKEYSYHFIHNDEDPEAFAWCQADIPSKIAVICLTKTWGSNEYNLTQVRKSAFHEVCEVMLCEMVLMAKSRDFKQVAFEGATHRVIRILENTVFDNID